MTEEMSEPVSADRRRRPPRWLIIALIVIVALPLAGAAVLKAMFPPERLREIAEPQIEKRIARDVSLGDVRLKVFPNIAIRLTDVSIANPPEGFSDTPAVRMEALDLRLELFPLLRRQFRLSQLRLVGPRVRYEVAADGSNNLAGLLVRDTAAGAGARADSTRAAGQTPRGGSFEIRDLVVVDGGFVYLNSETRRAARLAFEGRLDVDPSEREDGPSASAGGVRLSEILWVADGRDTTRLPDVDVTYRAVFEPGGGRIAAPELHVRAAGLELTGEAASRRDTATGARTVRLELASGEFRIPELLAELPAGMVADTLEVDGRARLDLQVAGELGGDPGPELEGSAEYRDVSLATPGRGRIAEAVSGTLAFTSETVRAPDVGGRLFGRPFEARVRVTGLGEPNPGLDAHLSGEFGLAQLNDFRAGPPMPVEGNASVALDVSGPAKAMDRWNVSGPIRLSNVAWSYESLPRPARVAAATIRLTGSGVQGDAVPVTIGDSDLSVTFSSPQLLRYYLTEESARGAPPLMEFTARSERLAAADLRRGADEPGYSDLLTARLAGARVGGRSPESIAGERYHRPDLSAVRATGTVSIAEWVNPPTKASDVSFRVDVADGRIEISEMSGTVYGGRLSGAMQLDLGAQEPPYDLEYGFELRGAGAGSLLERWTRLGRALDGIVDLDISGSAPLDDVFLPVTVDFAATGRSSFVEGSFGSFDLPDALRSRLNLSSDRFRGFRDLGGPFEIREGRLLLQNWTFSLGDVQGAVSGGAGLAGLLDLDLALLVPPSVLRGLPGVGADAALGQLIAQLPGAPGGEAARDTSTAVDAGVEPIPLRLGVAGTIRNPEIRLDREALISSLRGRITREGRERIEDEGRDLLEEAAGGLLDRLRGQDRDTAVSPDTASRDTLQQ